MEIIRSGGGDDGYLRALALAVGGGVGIRDDVEFPDSFDAQELAGCSPRRNVDQRCARVLDAVEQVEIVLRAASRDSEHVANRRVRCAYRAATLCSVVDGRRIQRDELIVTATVQRKFFDLARVDEASRLLRGEIDHGWVIFHVDCLSYSCERETEVDVLRLPYGERNSGASLVTEAIDFDGHGVGANGD